MKEERRADPDDLLAGLQEETKGKLIVFLGAAAGVGKTYAMLEAAHERLTEGLDVVAGWIEPHVRQETVALQEGIPSLPPCRIEYRGSTLAEMDLDALLVRKPALVLVDELAHTNVPGSRHLRRYQDVEELLAAGIDVYTTLNIQHVESLNDIVAQITGVTVRETVPDQIIEKARIQLIDIPPEELIQRLEEGKVYVPRQAEDALRKFFRPGNINALRELSLRYTAQRVDRQMETYMRAHGIAGPWPAGERVMVSLSPSPFSAHLIRIGRRIAVGLKAEFLAVYVETPRRFPASEDERDQLVKNLHLAHELEAEVIRLSGEDVAEELLAFARKRNVTQIIIGKPRDKHFWDALTSSVVDRVVRNSQDIGVHVIPGETRRGKDEPNPRALREKFSVKAYVGTLIMIVGITILGRVWGSSLGSVNMAMLFLLPVLFASVRWGLKPGVVAAIIGLLAYDFFFVPPTFSFTVADFQYVLSFAIFVIVALLTAKLSTRLKQQVVIARKREAKTRALYALSQEIAAESDLDVVLQSIVSKVAESVDGQVAVFLPDEMRNLTLRACSKAEGACFLTENERAVAVWTFEHGQMAGRGTDTLGGATGFYLPLLTKNGPLGVLGIQLDNPERYLSPELRRLVEAFAGLAVLAVSRILLAEQAREAQLLGESEKLRTALLNALSHDLRTPLASMIGAVTGLLEGEELYSLEARRDLLQTIQQGAMRMNRLVNNLLDMARLESGIFQLNKEWCDLEDVLGVAIRRLGDPLANRPLKIDIKQQFFVLADFTLIEQVFVNLLDNALKYSEHGSEIQISMRSNRKEVEIAVMDRGTPIPEADLERVFDKFYRIKAPRQISGTGLGLSICKGIVEAHGGRIWAENNPQGCITMTFSLPRGEGTPPKIPKLQGEGDVHGK